MNTTILTKGRKLQVVDHDLNRVKVGKRWYQLKNVSANEYIRVSVEECGFSVYICIGVTMADIIG